VRTRWRGLGGDGGLGAGAEGNTDPKVRVIVGKTLISEGRGFGNNRRCGCIAPLPLDMRLYSA
jgi:hypothetical protein